MTPSACVRGLPEYKAAAEFNERFRPKDEVRYDWVTRFAQEKYRDLAAGFKGVDDKADGLIRYIVGGTGLFALAGLASAGRMDVWVYVWAGPAVVAAFLALVFAWKARTPGSVDTPPPIRDAIRYAEHYRGEGEAEAAFLGAWEQVCVGLRLTTDRKARLVGRAEGWFVCAVILLLLPPVIAVISGQAG